MFRLAATAALIAGTPAPVQASHWVSSADAGKAIDGVWRSRGYGHILVVRDGGRALYHVAGPFCYPDPAGTGADDDMYRLASIMGPTRIAFAAAPDQTRYEFDRIAALPSSCAVRHRWTAHEIADLIAVTFADLYAGFDRRGRKQDELTTALATSNEALPDHAFFQHITRALESLDDAHVGLAATIDGTDHEFEGGEAATIRSVRSNPTLGTDGAERERS